MPEFAGKHVLHLGSTVGAASIAGVLSGHIVVTVEPQASMRTAMRMLMLYHLGHLGRKNQYFQEYAHGTLLLILLQY